MSVSSTEHLDKLAFILYDRPAGRNVIGYAIEKIEQLRADNEWLRAEIERLKQEPELLRAELISLDIAARKALADSNDRARDARWKASHERARNAMEGKP